MGLFWTSVLELVLRRERTWDGQLALVRFHRFVDLAVEGPAAVVAVVTGFILAASREYWTALLVVKAACALAALAANLVCVVLVVRRAALAGRAADGIEPGRRYATAILATGLGVPFGFAALLIALRGGF